MSLRGWGRQSQFLRNRLCAITVTRFRADQRRAGGVRVGGSKTGGDLRTKLRRNRRVQIPSVDPVLLHEYHGRIVAEQCTCAPTALLLVRIVIVRINGAETEGNREVFEARFCLFDPLSRASVELRGAAISLTCAQGPDGFAETS